MEELFINKTKITEKEYDIFLKSYQEEYTSSETLYLLFNTIFFGICMILAFREGETILGIIILLGLLVYLWFKIIRPTQRVQKDKKSKKVSGKFINTYKFYKNFLRVENPDGNAQIYYIKLYRVVETETHFYIYLSREYAFIVSKEGFTKGNSEEFAKFLKKKTFNKYKNRIKNNKK